MDQRVREMIGRTAYPGLQSSLYRSRAVKTIDETQPEYAYWDSLRRCKLPGYKLGGLFAKRIERVLASWIFGEGINVTLNKDIAEQYPEESVIYTNEQLKNFIDALLDSGQDNEGDTLDLDDQSGSMLLNIFRDAAGLGDQYPVVNSDGSLSIPSPDTVEMVRDELDYRLVLAVRITTKLDKVTIVDEYRADGRTVTIRRMVNDRIVEEVEQYANLIGRIPVVHVAYGRSGNEIYGHSIHEELRPLYDQYDDVLEKMLDGAKLLGNPFLAFTGLEDVQGVHDGNKPASTQTYADMQGVETDRPLLNLDKTSIFLVGKGGDAKFVSPPVGFSDDVKASLSVLFWLLFEHIGIPESLWGGELSSARATSETQLAQFVKELKGWQKENGGWVVKLCKIWLQWRALTDPRLVVDKLSADWPAAVEKDKELLLKLVQYARDAGLLKNETALRLLELVEDAAAEVEEGQVEAQARADDEQARMEAQAAAAAKAQPQRVGEMSRKDEGGRMKDESRDPDSGAPSGPLILSLQDMHNSSFGYNEVEAQAIVAGAIRQIAGGA